MLNDKAMIINLTISQWTARKYDPKVSKEVEDQHEAQDAGRYNKILVSRDRIQKIQKVATRIRSFHYENTLVWGDNGERLLPTTNYFEYMTRLEKLKQEFNQEVSRFMDDYDNMVQESRVRLNGMFREQDYPAKSVLVKKFGVHQSVMPVPETDFRVALDDDELSKLKAQAHEEIKGRVEQAIQDIWSRIHTQLNYMYQRLSEKESVFKNSLFDNLKDLVILLPRLNVCQDPKLETLAAELLDVIEDPDRVRKSIVLRSQVVSKIRVLLTKYEKQFQP